MFLTKAKLIWDGVYLTRVPVIVIQAFPSVLAVMNHTSIFLESVAAYIVFLNGPFK